MNEIQKSNIKLGMNILFIIVAFFLGYLYAQRELYLRYTQNTEEKIYIDITRSSKNITIKNTPENIFFRIDGELVQSGSIDLK